MNNVKIDSLFFYHVYADLTNLVKSRKLEKSVFDMNTHYLELLNFLNELKLYHERLLDQSSPVFPSEPRLYVDESSNHRKKAKPVYGKLFDDSTEDSNLLQTIQAAAEFMSTKVADYKKDQLPGGKYWDPPEEQKQISNSSLTTICDRI